MCSPKFAIPFIRRVRALGRARLANEKSARLSEFFALVNRIESLFNSVLNKICERVRRRRAHINILIERAKQLIKKCVRPSVVWARPCPFSVGEVVVALDLFLFVRLRVLSGSEPLDSDYIHSTLYRSRNRVLLGLMHDHDHERVD